MYDGVILFYLTAKIRAKIRARIRQSTARKQALEECCGSVKYLLHPDASQRFLRLPFITLLVIMAGKRNAVEAVQKRKKENQLLSDCNSNRSRTIQMTVRVRSCRRRHVQSATIYFCLPTLPAYLCILDSTWCVTRKRHAHESISNSVISYKVVLNFKRRSGQSVTREGILIVARLKKHACKENVKFVPTVYTPLNSFSFYICTLQLRSFSY